ncbi:MAG: asparagine synthase (glutamine-hydrolyzing) [Acidiferrobacterales bacterium]|nr:asparagine synthase (glutamine-hydrolyzing) [Acidiferrobacterales bacterium]
MCGITGIVASVANADQLVSDVATMCAKIQHRGPDGQGITDPITSAAGASVVLGHRRLSIVDLTGGHQPMVDTERGLHLTFNGEIYNFESLREELIAIGHTFQTSSDTEVVLRCYAEYGKNCVEKFNGMYALAIWDEREDRLFLARDRYGKKPLYYINTETAGFAFSSEIKSFFSVNSAMTINRTAVWNCSLLRYNPGEHTLFNEIREVLPGHCGFYDPATASLELSSYYSHPDSQKQQSCVSNSQGSHTDQFLRLLRDAVKIRTNCDVPFGAFLSGGIDSAAVVAIMSEYLDQPVKTFSVGFRQTEFSELASAATVAAEYKTEHHECIIEPDDIIRYLPEAIEYRDGPVSEPSDVAILMLSRLARESVKMVLTGEGSDEVLGGYPKHVYERCASLTEKLPRVIRRCGEHAVTRVLPYKYDKIKICCASLLADDFSSRMQIWFGSMTPQVREKLFKSTFMADLVPEQLTTFCKPPGSSLRNILAFDQQMWLPGNLLERGDRMTMAASIEARMPFLDYRIAEFVSALPDSHRVHRLRTKAILRDAIKTLLPSSIINRKKVGFKVPVEVWFRTTLYDYLNEQLLSDSSLLREHLNQFYLEKLMLEHRNKKQNHEKLLWSLLNLEMWLKQVEQRLSGRPLLLSTGAPDSVALPSNSP